MVERTARAIACAVVIANAVGCGASGSSTETQREKPGGLRVALDGSISTSSTIAVRDVFDPQKAWLVQCAQKDHTLEGQAFCDELLVLPPGVYDVVVQGRDGCRSAQDEYQVVVNPGETSEITVTMICADPSGALDTIVTSAWRPSVTNIDFAFENSGESSNKFVCRCATDFTRVTVDVTDQDTVCADLVGAFTLFDSQGELVNPTNLISATGRNPDLTLIAEVPGGYDVLNADDPAHLIFTATGTEELAFWTDASGNPVGFANTNWQLTWNAATQTGTINVIDVTDPGNPQTLVTGTVTNFWFDLFSGDLAHFVATVELEPNAIGLPPAPAVNIWQALAQMMEVVPGDPSHLTGPLLGSELSDLAPVQSHGTLVDGVCQFPILLETTLPIDDYTLNFTVSDPSGLSSTLDFPVHFIDCGFCPVP